MSPEFLRAICPEPTVVLRVQLKPLSIGHIILLHRFENAFAKDLPPTLDDVVMATFICGHTYQGFLDFLDTENLTDKLKEYGKDFTLEQLPAARDLLTSYFSQGIEGPEIADSNGASDRTPGAPWLQRLRVQLMSKLHISRTESFDYPYALALWDYCTFLESKEALEIVSPEKLSEFDELIAYQKEQEAANGSRS